jgi:Ni,Fe-hydrogenase III large subunit/Ni,Fe-hydrogenase III component G
MKIAGLDLNVRRLPTPFPLLRGDVRADEWSAAALAIAENHGRLVTLWGSDFRRGESSHFVISAVYALTGGTLVWLDLPLPGNQMGYPDIAGIYPHAARQQRAVADLLGFVAEGASDTRPWLNHGAWPMDYFPLRREATGLETHDELTVNDYPFVAVAGEGVHEIAVGPVHAGIIEPGHFRFSVVGEKTLRLEERLGYTHKGIDKRFEHLPASEGHRLAGRVSGDSTVAYAWAYCMALEAAWALVVPPRALWLRALLLERERVANHLGDLGALGNDAAFGFGLSQFMRLKEDWLRLNKTLFGHRFMMDRIVPGGVATDLDATGLERLLTQCDALEAEVRELHDIYDEHAGLQDRFLTTGRVTTEQAMQLGLTGLAGRASGIARDVRLNFPAPPYTDMEFTLACRSGGDVAARVAVRFDEIIESLRLIRQIVRRLPAGAVMDEEHMAPAERPAGAGAGWIEGWRGEILVALTVEPGNRIARCHCHDPSWQNWPVLEHAVIGNIVPDFPLINKSFNLSYSGHDR